MARKIFDELVIGIPKEIMAGERRVAAIPATVTKLVAGGATVLVEEGAGLGAYIADEDYQKAGAILQKDPEEVYEKANIIMKVKEPQYNKEKAKHEVDMMHKDQVLLTFIHPAAPANHQMVESLAKKGVVSLTLDGIPRISRAQAMDALTSMSTVAGYKSVLMATDRLAKFMPMIGTAVGMIKPATVLVVGAGVAGLQAIATAKRLGAVVYAIDIRPEANEQAKSLGAKIIDSGIPPEVAIGAGGYAKSLPEKWLLQEREALKKIIGKVDVAILTALVPGKVAPQLLSAEMVKTMQPGSVIVDVAIDQGGNCELTVGGEIIEAYQISIDGTKNIPGMVPVSSTWMFAHNIYNLLEYLAKDGELKIDQEDEIVASSLVTKDGKILHQGTLEAMSQKRGIA